MATAQPRVQLKDWHLRLARAVGAGGILVGAHLNSNSPYSNFPPPVDPTSRSKTTTAGLQAEHPRALRLAEVFGSILPGWVHRLHSQARRRRARRSVLHRGKMNCIQD